MASKKIDSQLKCEQKDIKHKIVQRKVVGLLMQIPRIFLPTLVAVYRSPDAIIFACLKTFIRESASAKRSYRAKC